jgi:hypothetical protein
MAAMLLFCIAAGTARRMVHADGKWQPLEALQLHGPDEARDSAETQKEYTNPSMKDTP